MKLLVLRYGNSFLFSIYDNNPDYSLFFVCVSYGNSVTDKVTNLPDKATAIEKWWRHRQEWFYLLTYLTAVSNPSGFWLTPQHRYAISGDPRQQLSNYALSVVLCHFPHSQSISSLVFLSVSFHRFCSLALSLVLYHRPSSSHDPFTGVLLIWWHWRYFLFQKFRLAPDLF